MLQYWELKTDWREQREVTKSIWRIGSNERGTFQVNFENKSYFTAWSGGSREVIFRNGDATCTKTQKCEKSWPIKGIKGTTLERQRKNKSKTRGSPSWVICVLFNLYLEVFWVFWLIVNLIIIMPMGCVAYLDM